MQVAEVFIGLGSNLQNPHSQVNRALFEIDEVPNISVLARSSLYRSKPMGPANQPDFVNAVVKVSTVLEPSTLLHALQYIEKQHRRESSSQRWGPRTLDLDILLYGDLQVSSKGLHIPHAGVTKREFVLIPLQEIDAHLIIPGKGAVNELIERLPPYQLTKIKTTDV